MIALNIKSDILMNIYKYFRFIYDFGSINNFFHLLICAFLPFFTLN